jgi:hypothetical protein
MKRIGLESLLDESLIKDINDALDYAHSFDSTLEEEWLKGNSSSYFVFHYFNHVLQPETGKKWKEYPDRDADGEYRIKMPPMSPEEYEKNADKLASETNVYSYKDRHHNYIGGVAMRTKDGVTKESYVKIRRSSQYFVESKYTIDGKPKSLRNMCEIVVYIKSPSGSNLIITYMMARNVAAAVSNFSWISDLPKSETTPPESDTYYLVVDEYKTTSGEEYFETIKFTSYVDANKHFSSNKKTSKLIKVENNEKKIMLQKNPKNVVPEVKNKDNKIETVSEALTILKSNC